MKGISRISLTYHNEYHSFVMTSIYPLDIPNKPKAPAIQMNPNELAVKIKSDAETSAEDICS